MKLKRTHPKPPAALWIDNLHCGDFGGFREGMEIRCQRDPDHEGDHECRTEKAVYLWRNKKKTPAA
jgi:hypothetical protein